MITSKKPEETRAYQLRDEVCKLYQEIIEKGPSIQRRGDKLLETLESQKYKTYFKGWGKLVCGIKGVKPAQEMFNNWTEVITKKNDAIYLLKQSKTLSYIPSSLKNLEETLLLLSTPLVVMANQEKELEQAYY